MSSSSSSEIIEIDDELSSSSLGNDSIKLSRSTFQRNTISTSSSTTSSSTVAKKSSSNSNKRYSSKFKKDWLSIPLFSSFLRECKDDPTKALCIVCNGKFSIQNSGLGDIHRHAETNKHKQSTKATEANRSEIFPFELPN
jgi:hypothetical protein